VAKDYNSTPSISCAVYHKNIFQLVFPNM